MEENTPRTTGVRRRKKTETDSVSKKTPVRKAVRKTVSAPKRTVSRKAPSTATVTKESSKPSRQVPLRMYAMLATFLAVVGISAGIGFSDDGQINVSNTIASQMQSEPQYDAQGQQIEVPPPEPAERTRNSGLVASTRSRPSPSAETIVPDVSSTTASSSDITDESATTTLESADSVEASREETEGEEIADVANQSDDTTSFEVPEETVVE